MLQLKVLQAGKVLMRISLSCAKHIDDYTSVCISNAIMLLVPMVHAGGRMRFTWLT